MTALLEVERLHLAFGGVDVLHGVTFAVPHGGRTALVGPNGAGKTSLFNVVSGVYAPSAGRVMFEGRDISRVPSRHRIGLGISRSFQNIRLMPHLSVVENVMLGQHARARTLGALLTPIVPPWRSSWRREAEQRLDQFGLGAFRGESVASLPYGVRKKIEVVRALMASPALMLLDEPAAGLNPSETGDLVQFLHGISSSGVTLLVVEHDMSLVRDLCGHAVVLNFGRLIYDGATAAMQDDPAVLEAYLGPSAIAHAA